MAKYRYLESTTIDSNGKVIINFEDLTSNPKIYRFLCNFIDFLQDRKIIFDELFIDDEELQYLHKEIVKFLENPNDLRNEDEYLLFNRIIKIIRGEKNASDMD